MNHPTPFQLKIFWAAVTALSFLAIAAVVVFVGSIVVRGISFLQPVLIPVAVAAILAFLLEPVVKFLMRSGLNRILSIIIVYIAFASFFAGLIVYIVPPAYRQGVTLVQNFPSYIQRAQNLAVSTIDSLHRFSKLDFLDPDKEIDAATAQFAAIAGNAVSEGTIWVQQKIPDLAVESGRFLQRSLGGFLGVFGLLLSLILVPIFLFFFLRDSPAIAENWSSYLPLRASPLKSEIVSLVGEVNSYLIGFFRGQLLVSVIDGILIATALLILGLDFAILIGIMVCFLGLIPYLGMMICYIPAVIIAAAQFGDWFHPLAVTLIFILANNLEGIFIAPKIVGESVGLHPLTVILSVLAWSLILGGLLGAILAVPLTATLKVLLKRYFWDKPARPAAGESPPA
ncbi:MAG: AI-2E family transporter [Verrucomicrobia bacterium]|nr:AI-2E family transporter [Verrucomicrobiota bacterium]